MADGIAALSLSGRLRPSRLPQGSIGKHLATLGPRFRNRKNLSTVILGLLLLPVLLSVLLPAGAIARENAHASAQKTKPFLQQHWKHTSLMS